MMKTMKKGLVRTVAFVVAWTLCWTTISNSLFTSVSYAAEAEEAAPVEEIIEEIPEETAEEAPAEEAPAEEAVVEETFAEEAEPQNLPLEGEVAAQPTEEVSSEQTADQVPAEQTKEASLEEAEAAAEPVEETIHATITYKASEGGKVSVKNETLTWKKITSIDENGAEEVTFEAVSTEVQGSLATADEGYTFISWTKNGKVVSEDETFVPAAVKEDVTYKAEFEEQRVEEKSSEKEATPHQSATPTASPQGEAQEQKTTKGDAQDQESETEDLPLEGKVPAEQADEVEDDTEEEDKVSYPAASFTGETGDVSVRAHVKEGVFPEGTTMNVSAVSASEAIAAAQDMVGEGTEVVDAVAADITFRYEGEEIQPEGGVYVRLSTKRAIAGESHEAITIDGSGSASSMGGASAHSASFDTDHFTVYGVYGGNYTDDDIDEYIRHTYEFYVVDHEDPTNNTVKVDEIIVHNGDTLTVPADPAGDAKHTFAGWFKADEEGNLTDEKVESGAVTIDPATKKAAEDAGVTAEDKIIKVYAKFDTQYTVTLYADADKERVFNTIIEVDGESVEIPSPEDAVSQGLIVPAGEKMTGWKYAGDNGKTVEGNTVTINGEDIELVPVFASSHNVKFELVKDIFDEIPDQNVLDGDKVDKPTQYKEGETYKGYRFGGWYTNYDSTKEDPDEAFSGAFDFEKALEEGDGNDEGNIILYAKWIPAEVDYTIEVWLESAHAHEEPFQLHDSVTKTGTSEEEVPVSEILITYNNDKYKSGTPGYFHWSGTGALNRSEERAVVEVESNGTGTVEYGTDGNPAGADAAVINPDGSTVVRIYYCRDTYRINFLFAGRGDDRSIVSSDKRYDGVYVSQTLSDSGKKLVPTGVPGDVTLPVINAKYGEWLYECTHITNKTYADVFDAFIDDQRWYFQRLDFNGSGETVFNHTNTQSPVKPNKVTKDGGDLYVLLYIKNQQKEYVYQYLYYDKAYTQEDIRSGKATVSRKGEVVEIFYAADGDHGHAHSFEIGKSDGGYKLVDISGQYGVKLNGKGDIRTDNPVLNDGTHKFYWVNGEYKDSDDVEWIYLHMVPKAYTITFKQTKNDGYVNGERISTDSKVSDVTIEGVFYGSDLSEILAGKVPDWNELTDDRGVVYSRKGDWLGDDVAEGGGFPNTMPDHDMVFYLDWTAGTYTVTYDPGYEGGKVVEKDNLAWGVRVPDPAELGNNEREGWTLLGWEEYEMDRDDDGNRKQGERIGDGFFTFNTPVKQDLYLLAKWAKPSGYQVVYQNGAHGKINGEDTVTDPMTYDSNAKAPVKYTATPEKGWVFTGWAIGDVVEDGTKLYGSGDVITYSAENDAAGETDDAKKNDSIITLVAQYAKADRTTKVTYHSNYPAGGPDQKVDVENLVINKDHMIALPAAANIGFQATYTAPDGNRYQFLGWTNDADNNKVYADLAAAREALDVFGAGETAAAGEKDNHLYALWQVIVNDTPGTDPDPDPDEPTPTPDEPTDIPDEPTPTTDTPDDPAPETVTPAPEPVNPIVTFIENILGVRRVPEEAAAADDDTPAVAGSRRSRVDTNDYSRMEYWMILALGCILIQADLLRKVKKQRG